MTNGIPAERYASVDRISWYKPDVLAKCTVMLLGVGALGNHIAQHLALNCVRILVVDRDTVSLSNLTRSPLFTEAVVGRWKAEVAAERLRIMNPSTAVHFIAGDIQYDVGLAHFLHSDIVIGGLDSRLARMLANRYARLAGIPYIDGGIDGESLTGRVCVHLPGDEDACYECSVNPASYTDVGLTYPCDNELEVPGVPTLSFGAAFIASVQVAEAVKLLLGMNEYVNPAVEMRWDMLHHTVLKTRVEKNPDCMVDHKEHINNTVRLPVPVDQCTVGDVFLRFAPACLGKNPVLDFHRDISVLNCTHCGKVTLALARPKAQHACTCSTRLVQIGYLHALSRSDAQQFLDMRLSDIGIPDADIISICGDGANYWFEFPATLCSKVTEERNI